MIYPFSFSFYVFLSVTYPVQECGTHLQAELESPQAVTDLSLRRNLKSMLMKMFQIQMMMKMIQQLFWTQNFLYQVI